MHAVVTPVVSRRADPVQSCYAELIEALAQERFADAESRLDELRRLSKVPDDDRVILRLRAILAIEQGRSHEFLARLSACGEDHFPELRAMCLYALHDPRWEDLARSLVDHADEQIAASMRALLQGDPAVTPAPGPRELIDRARTPGVHAASGRGPVEPTRENLND